MKQAGKITCDDGGCGDVHFLPSFLAGTPLYRADVLQDCIHDLLKEYNRARKQLGWRPVGLVYTDDQQEAPTPSDH